MLESILQVLHAQALYDTPKNGYHSYAFYLVDMS